MFKGIFSVPNSGYPTGLANSVVNHAIANFKNMTLQNYVGAREPDHVFKGWMASHETMSTHEGQWGNGLSARYDKLG
jgi:hypothetical protein